MVAMLLIGTVPAAAQSVTFPILTADELAALFSDSSLDNLAPIGPAPWITGDPDIDDLIRQIAETRGYVRRPLPSGALASVDGYTVQPLVVDAWEGFQAAARAAGHNISIQSSYRTESYQRDLFLSQLTGTTEAEVDARLQYSAPPGYSKHHTGYALDITEDGVYFTSFGGTASYDWMAADNFYEAKRFGFIPSYPPEATSQGPVPEPWEWTYVGVENILCGGSVDHGRFCDDDGSLFEADIEWLAEAAITEGCNPPDNTLFCPRVPVSRGQMAAFLSRALQLADAQSSPFSDDDSSIFEDDIARVAAAGITVGCNPPSNDRFCPDLNVSRGEMAAFLVRAFGYVSDGGGDLFTDDDGSIFEGDIDRLAAAGVTLGCDPESGDEFCPELPVTREQMAAFLHRAIGP